MTNERYLVGGYGTNRESRRVASPLKIEAFLDEYEALCRKHGLSLSHEDGHGGFEIEVFDKHNIDWVRQAAIGLSLDANGNSTGEK
jgi:hypothetical protein